MDLGLEGKIAIVTGGGGGYGHGICLVLAREGCDIVVDDIDLEDAEKTAGEVRSIGRQALAVKADVSSSREIGNMVATVLKKFGEIDILVNNAAVMLRDVPFAETTEERWDKELSIDLKGPMICSKAVLSHMMERRYGKIINISGGAGRVGQPKEAIYSAAKAGLIGFTKALAVELIPYGINVNSAYPGTNPKTKIWKNASQELYKSLSQLQNIPAGRLCQEEDLAHVVAFLASDVSCYVVGQVYGVEGGRIRQ